MHDLWSDFERQQEKAVAKRTMLLRARIRLDDFRKYETYFLSFRWGGSLLKNATISQ